MKTTKKQFEQFKAECLRLQGVLGLMEWDIYFDHEDLKADEYARIITDVDGLTCVLKYNMELDSASHRDANPVKTAKHEMSHLLLAKLRFLATCRYLHEEELSMEVEGLCNVLEKVL